MKKIKILFFSLLLFTPVVVSARHFINCSNYSDNSQIACYVVKERDTLWDISKEFLDKGIKWKEIKNYVDLHRSIDPKRLLPGTKLQIKLITEDDLDQCPEASIVYRRPIREKYWQNLGLDISKHPEVMSYQIQWSSGYWSLWYTPGVDDVDWKLDSRRVWSYFEDHTHRIKVCGDINERHGNDQVSSNFQSMENIYSDYKKFPITQDLGTDKETNRLYELYRNYGSGAVVEYDNKIYGGPFNFVKDFKIDDRTNNKFYLADTKDSGYCKNYDINHSPHGFQVVFNKDINPHYSCGWDYKLLSYNPSGEHYAIRNNEGLSGSQEKFIVLSDIGNSEYYDYIDSLTWYDDNTLIYRAQNNGKWIVVINNKDYETYDYLKDLRVEDDKIKFSVKSRFGFLKQKSISL